MKIAIYHKTETLAKRARRPRPGETLFYKAIKDFDTKFNDTMDHVEVLCEQPKKKKVKKTEDGV